MRKLVQNILYCIAKRLYPYWIRLEDEHLQNRIDEIRHQLAYCGENLSLGKCFRMEGAEFITIGNHFRVSSHVRIEAIDRFSGVVYKPNLIIGNNVTMEDYCHIGCVDSVTIGDGTLIASKVFITDHFHGGVSADDVDVPPFKRKLSHQPVKIGRNVWIGDGVCILPGVELGDNVVVGANAVVTKSFPANSVIAGVPAKMIRNLSDRNG